MLPFSGTEFFLLMLIFVLLISAAKYFIADLYYKYFLAVLNLLFLVCVFPMPMHFILLVLFSYLSIWLFSEIFKTKQKIWGIIVLLIPLLLVKFDIRFHFYPFKLNNLLSFAGLSYASFRIVGYYMDKTPGEKMPNLAGYFNFLAFTPTMLIGPIDRYNRFAASEAKGFSSINPENFIVGWNAVVKGVVFKYIIAEFIDRYWLSLYAPSSTEMLHMANTMYAYYFYLFFDFAGYSFMALGIGKMMGMNVPVNFKNPFTALNPQDFWRKFHISLGDWLRDYFFTPLYMFLTRKKRLKQYPLLRQNTAMILTFVLMGCWNGFKWNFIVSGLLFGIYSAVYNTYAVQCKKKGRDVVFGNMKPVVVKAMSIFIVFHLVAVALYVFSGRTPV